MVVGDDVTKDPETPGFRRRVEFLHAPDGLHGSSERFGDGVTRRLASSHPPLRESQHHRVDPFVEGLPCRGVPVAQSCGFALVVESVRHVTPFIAESPSPSHKLGPGKQAHCEIAVKLANIGHFEPRNERRHEILGVHDRHEKV